MITIRIPSPLRQFTEGREQIQVEASDVGTALGALLTSAPGIEPRLYKPGAPGAPRTLNRFVNLYVNDEDIRFLQNLQTPLKPGDTLSIVPAIAGG